MNHFQLLLTTSDELVKQLNAPLSELAGAASDLLSEKAANEKNMKELQVQLLEKEAESIRPREGDHIIEQVFRNRPIKEVQQLARIVIAQAPSAHLLFLTVEGKSVRFVGAKGEAASGNMKDVLPELLSLTDGKGGGNASFIQGGGNSIEAPDAFTGAFRNALKNN